VASSWFFLFFSYHNDARSNKQKVLESLVTKDIGPFKAYYISFSIFLPTKLYLCHFTNLVVLAYVLYTEGVVYERPLFRCKQNLCSAGNIRRRRSVNSYRRFGALLPFKMGPIRCSETSVNSYQSTLRNIPEERRSRTCVINRF